MKIDEENHNVGNIIEEEINLFDDREKDRVAENDDFGTEAELIIDKKEKEIENGEDQGKENHEPPRRYNLRPKKSPDYSHRFALLSVHAGVRKWEEKAKEAIRDELKMLKKENVFKEVSNPTAEQV